MEKKVMSKDYLLNHREELLRDYHAVRSKSHKAPLLTKKERKVLGIGKDQGVATAKNVRISPRKVNIVLKLIRNKPLHEALAILQYTPKAASEVLIKLLKSAEANAVNNNELLSENLYVHGCYANQGPVLKRLLPRGRGSASRIFKRTSHVTVVLKEKK